MMLSAYALRVAVWCFTVTNRCHESEEPSLAIVHPIAGDGWCYIIHQSTQRAGCPFGYASARRLKDLGYLANDVRWAVQHWGKHFSSAQLFYKHRRRRLRRQDIATSMYVRWDGFVLQVHHHVSAPTSVFQHAMVHFMCIIASTCLNMWSSSLVTGRHPIPRCRKTPCAFISTAWTDH